MRLKQLWRWPFRRRPESREARPETVSVDSSQNRALVWLGRDRLERQYYYEHWACFESWQVYKQGIPLLLGRDPDDPELDVDTEFVRQRNDLWEHLQHCVERRVSPQLINPADVSGEWLAQPVELYRWAVAARLDVPEELDALLSFISMTVKPAYGQEADTKGNGEQSIDPATDSGSMTREQVLSVMLSLSLQAQHQTSGADADAIREFILKNLYAKSELYFGRKEPPLSRPALHDLIDRSLEMAGLIRMPG